MTNEKKIEKLNWVIKYETNHVVEKCPDKTTIARKLDEVIDFLNNLKMTDEETLEAAILEHDAIDMFCAQADGSLLGREFARRHLRNHPCKGKELRECPICQSFQDWLDNQKLQ